jgi:type II secretory pathway component PulF
MMAIYKPNKLELALAKLSFLSGARKELYEQLASLTDVGMDQTDALHMAWDVASEEGKKPKEMHAIVLQDVILAKQNGAALGEAMSPWVPDEDVMVLKAIENSDNFAQNLRNFIALMEKKKKIKSTIIFGSIFPIALFAGVLGIISYFSKHITPIIAEILPVEKWTGGTAGLRYMTSFAENYLSLTLGGVLAFAIIMTIILPRWTGAGRVFADRLPIFSTYRVYTGISFLVAIASLIQGGMTAPQAVDQLRGSGSAYVKSRIRKIYNQMLNGANFGAAMHRTGTDWPDRKMNLSIKLFSETQDLSEQLTKLSMKWLDDSQIRIQRSMNLFRNIGMLMAAGCLIVIMMGIFSLQSTMQTAM